MVGSRQTKVPIVARRTTMEAFTSVFISVSVGKQSTGENLPTVPLGSLLLVNNNLPLGEATIRTGFVACKSNQAVEDLNKHE